MFAFIRTISLKILGKLAGGTLCLLLIGSPVHAKQKIVILSGIQNQSTPLVWRRAHSIIKSKFKAAFKNSPFEIVFALDATQEELYNHLNSEETVALFWISHSAAGKTIGEIPTLQTKPIIVDSYNRNVTALFQKISPSIKILALIGCESNAALQSLQNAGYNDNLPDLEFFTFAEKIYLPESIDSIIKVTKPKLTNLFNVSNQPATEVNTENDLHIEVSRPADTVVHDSIQIFFNNRLITVLPPTSPNSEQKVTLSLPFDPNLKNKLVFKTGFTYTTNLLTIGQIKIKPINTTVQVEEFEIKNNNQLPQQLFYLF